MSSIFRASEDVRGDLYALQKNCQQADKHQQSWMYWQFKYYQDITTCTPVGESLYDENGEIVMDKLRVLSRSYPQIVAGAVQSYHFNMETAKFDLTFTPLASVSLSSGATAKEAEPYTSELYVNREIYYPHGVSVTFSSQAEIFAVQCSSGSNVIQLVQQSNSDASAPSTDVTVSLAPCGLFGDKETSIACTCK